MDQYIGRFLDNRYEILELIVPVAWPLYIKLAVTG